jgi:hypothetical protein
LATFISVHPLIVEMDNKKSEGKDDPPSSPTILNRHGKPAMETKNGVIVSKLEICTGM